MIQNLKIINLSIFSVLGIEMTDFSFEGLLKIALQLVIGVLTIIYMFYKIKNEKFKNNRNVNISDNTIYEERKIKGTQKQ